MLVKTKKARVVKTKNTKTLTTAAVTPTTTGLKSRSI
jgi:hypothetical protein